MPKTIRPIKKLKLVLARKVPADGKLVMKWRNDPDSLSMFYHSKPKVWKLFWPEYKHDYFLDHRLKPRFVVYQGKKIGFIRFSKYMEPCHLTGAADIDVNLSPSWRGKGFGVKAIETAKNWIFKKKFSCVIAEIKIKNQASIHAFRAAGFVLLDRYVKQIEDIGQSFKIIRLVAYAKDIKGK